MLIGYARVEEGPDHDEQRSRLLDLGVDVDHIWMDTGLGGTRRELPHRTAMLEALTPDDIVVVTGLERLARTAAELGTVTRRIAQCGAALRVGDTLYDPATDTGRTAFDLLTEVFPQFEAGIYELRLSGPREKAKAAGRYPGGKPKLTVSQRRKMFELHESREKTVAELQKEFQLSRSAVYMHLQHERRARHQN